jgi:tetratricopeptide (TPR) repeat protein
VVGLDEVRARSALADMQDRLARGPIAALGITASSSPEDARAAFLQLTKRYHPIRFGRMATDIQKLANEVFLALRAAHDSVARTLRRPPAHVATQPLPIIGPVTVVATPLPAMPSNANAVANANTAVNGRAGQGLPPRPVRPPEPSPPHGMPTASVARPAALRVAAPAAASRGPTTARLPGSPSAAAPAALPATARDEAAVLDLLQRQQWDQARSALHQLSARDPSSRRIRALVCYARGREAQLDRRLDDARVELQDALELDPDLQPAKTALTELFTRRK